MPNTKTKKALWRVLDNYKRAALRRGQAPAKQLAKTLIKRSTQSRAKWGVRR